MKTTTHLFLDLEDTIVTPLLNGWANFNLVNVDLIKTWMSVINPDHVHIFSFAIHGDFDKKAFDTFVRPAVENVIGRSLEMVPTVDDDIIPTIARRMRLVPETVTLSNVNEFWGKDFAFQLFANATFPAKDGEFVKAFLLDDTTEFSTHVFPKNQLQVEMIKIPC